MCPSNFPLPFLFFLRAELEIFFIIIYSFIIQGGIHNDNSN
jgi:hypothetical protein